MKELVYSVDPWIAAWAADRLNEIKTNKEATSRKAIKEGEKEL